MGGKPFLRRSGPDFMRDGEAVSPRAFMHPCFVEDCSEWGAFGYGARLTEGKIGRWACGAHAHLLAPQEPPEPTANPTDLFG